MDERTKQVLVGIIVAVIFIASVALIIIGQKKYQPQGLDNACRTCGSDRTSCFYNHKYK